MYRITSSENKGNQEKLFNIATGAQLNNYEGMLDQDAELTRKPNKYQND